jgi:HEAT repeats
VPALCLLLALAAPDDGPKPADVPALALRLGHADPSVRRGAAGDLWLLERDAGPARPALVRALRDPSAGVRLRAALALSRLDPPDPAALPWLRAMRGLPRWPDVLAVGAPPAGELLAVRLTGRWPDGLPLALELAGLQLRTVPFELRMEAEKIAAALQRYERPGR